MNNLVTIPTNYTDAGKIFGLFEVRNTIEAVGIGLPLAALIFFASPFGLMATIIGGAIVVVPVCGFALLGILDSSLLTFLRFYLVWRIRRRITTYKGAGSERKS